MVRGFMGGGSGWLSSIAPNTNEKVDHKKACLKVHIIQEQ